MKITLNSRGKPMTQFHAAIQGDGKHEITALGGKGKGMRAVVQSWAGRINVRMWYDPCYGCDFVRVTFGPHSSDGDEMIVLFEGRCDAWQHKLAMRAVRAANSAGGGERSRAAPGAVC